MHQNVQHDSCKMFEFLRNTRYLQYLAGFTATFYLCSTTTYLPWGSPMLPLLTSENSPIGVTLTDEEASWIVSSLLITSNLNLLLVPITVQKFGPRLTLLASTVPLVASWLIIIFARSFLVLLLGRLLGGFCLGVLTVAVTMYNGEIAEPDIRGKVALTFTIMRLFGSLVVLTIGPFVSYKTLGFICCSMPLVSFFAYYPMPESPYFLTKTGRKQEACKSLVRLSKKSASEEFVEKKLLLIEDTVQNDMKNSTSLWTLLRKSEYRMAVWIMLGVKTLQELNGGIIIDTYLQTIMDDARTSSISPQVTSLICGCIQIPAALVSAYSVDKFGRKSVLFVSAFFSGLTFTAVGFYFYQQSAQKDVTNISWLPAVGIIIYSVTNVLGCASIPYVLLGELFPTNVKDNAIALFTTYGGLLAFGLSVAYEPVSKSAGRHVTFWFFAGVSFMGSLFAAAVLPETKGKTFAEIQEMLNRKRARTTVINEVF